MQQHIPFTGGISLIHNDYKYDNVVLNPGDITKIIGVLDWEMSTIGDPLTDLGTTLAYWVDAADPDELQENRSGPTTQPGGFTRAALVEFYPQKTSRDVSQISFFLTLARFQLACIVHPIYYRYLLGLTKHERFPSMPRPLTILLPASLHSAQT